MIFRYTTDHLKSAMEGIRINLLALVGLRVSVSHDLGEITCEIIYNLMILFVNILFIDIRYTY